MNNRSIRGDCKVVILLCNLLWTSWAFALSGVTTGGSDTQVLNAQVRTYCGAGVAQSAGALACLGGRSGGQIFTGDTTAGGKLTLNSSTSSTTAGDILFNQGMTSPAFTASGFAFASIEIDGLTLASNQDTFGFQVGGSLAVPTATWTMGSGAGGNELHAFVFGPKFRSAASTTQTTNYISGLLVAPTIAVGNAGTWTISNYTIVGDRDGAALFQRDGGSGTLTVTSYSGLETQPTLNTGVTIGTRRGVFVKDMLGSGGAQQAVIGLDVTDQTISGSAVTAAVQSGITSGANKWGFYSVGGADNLLAGNNYGSISPGGNLVLRSTFHATKGKIIFGSAADTAFDEVNDRFGLLTASPATTFHLSGSLGEVQMDSSGTSVTVARYGAASSFAMRGASGSKASPALTANGLTVGNFDFQGLTNVGSGTFTAGARLSGTASETWSSSVNGMGLSFATTPNGTSTLTTRALITSGGSLQLIGSPTIATPTLLFQSILSDNSNFQIYFNNTDTYTTTGPNIIPMVPVLMRQTSTFNFAGATSDFVQAAVINEQHWIVADGTTLTSNTATEGAFRDATVFEKWQNGSCGSGTGNPWPCCTGVGTGTCAGTGALGGSSRYWSFETEPHIIGVTLPEYGAYVADTAVLGSGVITTERAFWAKPMVGSTKISFQSDDAAATERFAGAMVIGSVANVPIAGAELQVIGNIVSAETSAFAHAALGGL